MSFNPNLHCRIGPSRLNLNPPVVAGRVRSRTGAALAVWLLVIASAGMTRLAAQQLPSGQWETLTNCVLLTNAVVDGDSFHVRHQDREHIFRLYFVDALESDPAIKDRIVDQAAYFGIAAADIPRAGRLAADFTRAKLTGREFTILTRWQNAMGRSSLARFYAVVLVDDQNLAAELVANGLARIYGLRANWPGGPRSVTFLNQLKNLELKAREKQLGAWDETTFARLTPTKREERSSTTPTADDSLIDINHASYERLQDLPGIGPRLAERIIAQRPFKSPQDLEKVPGIGPATLKRLTPLIKADAPTP